MKVSTKEKEIVDFLKENNIPYEAVEHEAVFHSHEEPEELQGRVCAKNLLLYDTKTGQVFMVVTRGEKRLDRKRLAEQLETTKNRLQFVRFDDVKDTVGVEPGHVSIFNLLHTDERTIRVIFDKELETEKEVGSHPSVNTATLFVSPSGMLRALEKMGIQTTILDI